MFALKLETLISRTTVLDIEKYGVRVIINPYAGGFSRKDTLIKTSETLDTLLASTEHLVSRKPLSWDVLITNAGRHATQLANDLLETAALNTNQEWFVILACGDGTTWEFLDGLTRAPREIVDRFTLLRLPLGTGNDGTDGWTLEDSLSRLFDAGTICRQPYVSIYPAKTGKQKQQAEHGFRAFNIVSIGLDAFVAHMTNKLKKRFPGDSFKLWLDLATVFYDSIYKTGTMKIEGYGSIEIFTASKLEQNSISGNTDKHESGKTVRKPRKYEAIIRTESNRFSIQGQFLLLAVGADGRRTYGSHQLILPDENNVCLIEKMSLFRKIKLKGPIVNGGHKQFPEVILAHATELLVDYDEEILLQMDGESVLLEPTDFPLRITIAEPVIRYLGRNDGKRHA